MPSSYPGGLDSFTNPTGSDNLDTSVGGLTHSAQHGKVNDAIEAIEGELGTNPSAGFSTVAARFTAVESDVTTLEAAVDALPTADETIFHVDDYGAVGNGSTDDTAAVVAAIAAADAAGGGTVQFGAATYLCNGSLVTSAGGNAVLALPTSRNPIRLRGVQPANQCDPRIDTGYSVIKTTKSGLTRSGTDGVPSLIGGPTDSTWAENMVSIEDLCLWLPANPTIAGLDLGHVRRYLVDGFSIVAINAGDTDYTNPTSVYAFGIRTSEPLNYNACLIRNAQVHGMYAGLVGSVESLTVEYFVAKWCKIGWAPAPGGHGASVLKMDLSWCPYSISGWSETAGFTSIPDGALGETDVQVSVNYLAIEDYAGTSKWYDPVYTVNDSTNRLTGVIFYDRYLMGSGVDSTLTLNGGTGLEFVSLLAPSFGGGAGTPLTVQDENSNVSTDVTRIDFQGAGVTTTAGTGEVVVTIAGGGSSTSSELMMQDGVSSPPVPIENEAGTDWLYTD